MDTAPAKEGTARRHRRRWRGWVWWIVAIALVVGGAWFTGWRFDPAPEAPLINGQSLAERYPDWEWQGSAAQRRFNPGLLCAEPSHVPWLLWRARQPDSPFHALVGRLRGEVPARWQAWIPAPIPDRVTRSKMVDSFILSVGTQRLHVVDLLREIERLPRKHQAGCGEWVRLAERLFRPGNSRVEAFLDVLHRLVDKGHSTLAVTAAATLLDGGRHLWGRLESAQSRRMAGVLDRLVQVARAGDGEKADWVRIAAFAAVRPQGDPLGPLLEALAVHPEPDVAATATLASCLHSQPEQLTETLRGHLDRCGPTTVTTSMNFLAHFFEAQMIAKSLPDLERELIRVLRGGARTAVVPLGPTETSEVWDVSSWMVSRALSPEQCAARILRAMGTNAAPAVSAMMDELERLLISDRAAAVVVAETVAKLSGQVAIPADDRLGRLLSHPFIVVPMLEVLGTSGSSGARLLPVVRPLLEDPDRTLRKAAFGAVMKVAPVDPAVWAVVQRAMEDPSLLEDALAAIPRLGSLARPGLPRLREILADPSQAKGMNEIRRLAAVAVAAVEGAAP